MRNTAVGLVRACHFEACVAVTAVAVLLGIAVGGLSPARLLLGGAVLAGQLSIGWLNDFLDAGRDTIAGRTDKPIVGGLVGRETVGIAAVVAAVCCVPLSLLVGLVPGTVHLVAVVSAWAYDAWLKSTVVSVAPFFLSFGLLPVFVVLSVPGAPVTWWLPVAGALLGGGSHFANVLPDLAGDAATGIRGLPHRLGATGSRWSATVLLLAAAVVLVVGPVGHTVPRLILASLAVVTLVVGLALGRRAGSRAAFNAVLVVALLDVGQLLLAGTHA
ncbi:MAG TPA: UbiA family prenyltransferase [Pseudonocardiaceae bacterium]|nr:UbiA family prenyltransferase [Pseudonocardiaceae bacterium]